MSGQVFSSSMAGERSTRRCTKLNVRFALRGGAAEESLEAFGPKGRFSHLMEVHRAKIDKALETTGGLASSWKHRLALMAFAIKDLEIDWPPDPIGGDG